MSLSDEARDDGLGDFDNVRIRYGSEYLNYVCDSELTDERCDNPQKSSPERFDMPARFATPMDAQVANSVGRILFDIPDLRILAPLARPIDLEVDGTILTPLSDYGFELSYRISPDSDWLPAMPSAGHWVSAKIRPDLGIVEGVAKLCGDPLADNETDSQACVTDEVGVAIDEVFDGDELVEYRIGVIPIFNAGEFDEGRYAATIEID